MRPTAMLFAAALAAALLVSTTASAETPRSMTLEIHGGIYTPSVDKQFQSLTPYGDIFGDDLAPMFGFHLDYQLYQGYGTVAVGGSVKYGYSTGNAIAADGTASSDKTSLHTFPFSIDLVYRFDWLTLEYGFPVAPYLKGGLTWMIWMVTNGKDEIANSYDVHGNGRVAQGGTFGWFAAFGLQIHLDWLHRGMAAEFDNEIGVNNSYLFAEFSINRVNDFGSSKSLDLSADAFSFGLLFEF